jgi:hypothetical protein
VAAVLLGVTGAIGLATPVAAAPDLELGLGLDESGSIDDDEFKLQLNAYQTVLGDPNVLPRDGSVAVGVWKFDGSVENIFDTRTIDSTSDVNDLTANLDPANVQKDDGGTAIDDAIERISTDLTDANGITSNEQIIDISTDGVDTTFGDPDVAAQDAVDDNGVEQVNCLGVGGNADCGFVAGAGSFSVSASDFNDFERALEDKITKEVNGDVPAPGTVSLLGAALVGAGLVLRRQS